jgi:beta-galactosidase
MKRWIHAAVLTVLAGVSGRALADFVWVEGEDAKCSVPANNSGWGNKEFLSGEKWMHLAIDAEKVDQVVKEDAVTIQYPLQIAKAGKYQVWDRVGMEFVRSPFQWRIDNGEWKAISNEELTTDLMEIAKWTEVAWLKMGEQQLDAGAHVLEVKIPKTKAKDGKTEKILYASDAVCLTDGEFRPNGKYKPNDAGRDEKDIAAEKNVFKLPEAPAGQRSSVSLKGDWEIARADEQMPGEVAAPIADLPKDAVWRAIPVPSDKAVSRPDLVFHQTVRALAAQRRRGDRVRVHCQVRADGVAVVDWLEKA